MWTLFINLGQGLLIGASLIMIETRTETMLYHTLSYFVPTESILQVTSSLSISYTISTNEM